MTGSVRSMPTLCYWRWDLMVPNKQRRALGISFICAHTFAFADEKRRDAFAYRHYLDSWGRAVPVFIWCLINGEHRISDVYVGVTTCWRNKGVRPTLFVFENARSAIGWRCTFGGMQWADDFLACKIWYLLFEDALDPGSMKQGAFSHVFGCFGYLWRGTHDYLRRYIWNFRSSTYRSWRWPGVKWIST